jgi:hypothetical protein
MFDNASGASSIRSTRQGRLVNNTDGMSACLPIASGLLCRNKHQAAMATASSTTATCALGSINDLAPILSNP